MKTKHFIVALFILPAFSLSGQISYEDVAVIINENDNQSVEIGQYFAQRRDIPDDNLIYVQCPSVELIDSAGFMQVLQQIEEKMTDQGLIEKVNYLVTTKGIPFNVRKSESCQGLDGVYYCSSFDSELSLMFSPWSDKILDNHFLPNPYYEKSEHFDRSNYGIYLVTRLDAYTVADAKQLIDRSGPGIEVAKSSAQFIIDFSYITEEAMVNLFTKFVQPAVNFLIYNDWHVVFDPSEEMVTDQSDVLGYYSINYQPIDKELNYNWLKGSVSEILLSTGNLTFYKEQNVFDELSIPDLLEEGAASACTYTNSMFFSQIVQLPIVYERYLDEGQQQAFNLAESYFMAMPALSNHYLVIGDPKTSLRVQQSGTEEHGRPLDVVLAPNPATDQVGLSFFVKDPGEYRVVVTDILGRVLIQENIHYDNGLVNERIDISSFPEGIYTLSLEGAGERYRAAKFIKQAR